jgi:LPS-assembly protein
MHLSWNRSGLAALCLLAPLAAHAAGTGMPRFIPPKPATPRVAPAQPAATGERQVLLQADEIVYDGNNQTVSAVGHVEIADQGRILTADRVIYDQDDDKVTASGHVSITDERGNVAFANSVVLTDRFRNGALNGFGALIGQSGRLAAASAQRRGGIVIANRTVYSPCIICSKKGERTPLWQVKAERVIYSQEQHRVRFRNAVMEVGGVPIFYTPFLSQPDPSVRYASGLLVPDFGNSTKIGYFTRLPVYVALSPTNDMTIAPMFSTLGGEMLSVEYRARWNNSGLWLQGSGTYNPDGGLSGSPGPQTYGHLFGSGRIALDNSNAWRVGFDIQTATNAAYMRFYDISYLDRLVNDLFIDNYSGRSRFMLGGYYFEGLRSTDQSRLFPYVFPRVELSYIPRENVGGGQLRFDLNTAALARADGPDSQRVTAELRWKLPFVFGGGQLWTFVADARGDIYHVDNDDLVSYPNIPAKSRFISRAIPYVGLDWRWPFIAQGNSGRSYILQPIAQFIAQPYGGNPRGLPIEDSSAFEFDDNNIFSFNRLPGYDLVESGPRTNVGMMAQALFPGGEVQALVGQTFRFKPDPVFNAFAGAEGATSDVVGRFSVKFPHLDITDRIDVDRGNGTVRRHGVYMTGTYNRSSFQLAYVQLPPQAASLGLGSREEVNIQSDLNIYQNWQVFVAGRRDLQAGRFLDTEYGLGYEDECLAISLAYRRKYTFDALQGVPPSTSIILRFSLKTGDTPIQPFSLFPQDVFMTNRP